MQIVDLVRLRERFGEIGQKSYVWAHLARRRLDDDASGLLIILLKQIDAGALMIHEGNEEQNLLREAMIAAGPASLEEVLGLIETGSWRLQMELRGWLTNVYDSSTFIEWIGSDLQRARVVASLTGVGEGSPSGIVRYLLTEFDSDEKVASSLYGDFVSGSWWGNESVRLNGQIEQLNAWVNDQDLSSGVKGWAREAIASLRHRLEVVLVQEAEEEH